MSAAKPIPIARALISVSDKIGLAELGRSLVGHGVEILSTGGSAKTLRENGLSVVDVAEYTGFPEVMGTWPSPECSRLFGSP